MKRILILAIAIMATFTSANAQKWENLFNGRNLRGWKQVVGAAKYQAKDGMIVGNAMDTKANSFLVTKKEYSDFILEFEFMTEGTNSGVQIRSHKDEKRNVVYGYQFEIDPEPRAWTGGIYDEARSMWLYRLTKNEPARSAYHPGWNKARIEAVGNCIRTWVNDVPCSNLVADKDASGFIALQVHAVAPTQVGSKICWRNIRICTKDVEKYVTPTSAPLVNILPNYITEEEKADGWQLLFDGKSTDQWQSAKPDKMGQFPEGGWGITEDGLLYVAAGDGSESTNGGDIITRRKYRNFILKVDFRLTQGANSGIKYFVDPYLNTGAGSAIGCEFQILDDARHPDAKLGVNGNRTLGSLYDLIPAKRGFWDSYTIDGWHSAMIVVNGNHVEHWLNDHKVVEYERNNQMWDALVDYSKYRDWPDFGNLEEGYILLQDHGNQVFYKNIKIKEL